ncbi:glycosyltransferase family 1 protein [Paenibacillus nanensis]|uniref:Glycosyltransferase family 1 protein n=1 Tax=Paenibacillus nanensis TaxID=393251 RepID=A0A3A1UY75_9BACL|nr:glycosyltransferase family 1 protein [Paenibacillus nanensis]RIX52636.1 glycosyltransferase family 1 protein [Paenibacillus nanensis]
MERPIRILHAAVNMNRGGAETLLMNLYRNVDRSLVQFDFLTSKEGVFDDEIRRLGGRVHRIPYIDQAGHRGYRRALRDFFRSRRDEYDIVHAHMDRMSGFVLRAAQLAGVPVRIAHSHNTRSEGSLAARLYKRYAGLYIGISATHRFACSSAAAKWLFPMKKNEAVLLKNGIDPEKFAYSQAVRASVREELGLSESTYAIGHVGRFNAQKNHAQLLEIFGGVQRRIPNSVLLMAGDGPLRQEMERKASELGITEQVRFLGVREDVERLLQAFDAFVFPSHHEGLPVTLVEAQASGLPCYISDAISREADLGLGLVHFLSNRLHDDYIARIAAGRERQSDRSSASLCLAEAGYDIRATARWIQDYYAGQREVRHENVNRIYANV